MNRRLVAAAFLLGLLIRIAGLACPGTLDVMVWKIWAFNGARIGATRLYGVGGSPPERRLLEYDGQRTTVDYPPLALFELSAAGALIRDIRPTFPNDAILTASLKLLPIVAEMGITLGLFLLVRKSAVVVLDFSRAQRLAMTAALGYWLNPASILNASFLGYLDPLFVLPVIAALLAVHAGWLGVAGALFAAAVLTKVQAVLVAPMFVLMLRANLGRLARFGGGMLYMTALVAGPFVLTGAGSNMVQALASLLRHDMLSAFAANLWWVVTYVDRAVYAIGDLGVWRAFTMPVRILAISTMVELGQPNPRWLSTALVLATFAWALWKARASRDPFVMAGVGAFLVHAYFVLGVLVHENHLFTTIPLLAIAAAGRPTFRPIFLAVSTIAALNLYFFYGIDGRGLLSIPRGVTVIDVTVLLALVNTAALLWHARLVGRTLSGPPASRARATSCASPAGTPSPAAPQSASA